MKGYKTYRHDSNPLEKKLHDTFVENFNNREMSLISLPINFYGTNPLECLTEREERIVISTIQWLGSPVGQKFLIDCGFKV